MGYHNTRVDVENALKRLNEAAKDLGLDRRFSVRYGRSSAGVSHVLEEIHPGLAHPTDTPIGRTFREAHDYLLPMEHALRSVKRDRDYRREEAVEGPRLSGLEDGRDPYGYPRGMLAPVNSVGIYDPDARQHRREREELATRPAEADQ